MNENPKKPIPTPTSEPGEWLDAADLVYVDDLPAGPDRSRIEKALAERTSQFAGRADDEPLPG